MRAATAMRFNDKIMKRSFLLLLLLVWMVGSNGQILRSIRGNVVSHSGIPLAGASVRVEGGIAGTATDVAGNFVLRVPEEATHLLVSYVGMQTCRTAIAPVLQIILQEADNPLDELLVVAYGRARRKEFTGAAAVVDGERWKARPLTVLTTGLEGLVPGLLAAESGGQPGAEPHLRIRGFGSVNADCEPLYVVDGALFHGALCDLTPEDIASVTVLKDAAATALYGSSAGNGVVLITTKTGAMGAPALTFSMKQGFSERGIPEYDRINVWEYYPLQWEMLRNTLLSEGKTLQEAAAAASAGVFAKLNYNPFAGVDAGEIVTADGYLHPSATRLAYGDDLDWEGELARKGYRGEYHLSYRMQGERGGMYAALSYLTDRGAIIASDLERFSALLKGDRYLFPRLRIGLSLNYVRTDCSLANTQDNASSLSNPYYFTRYIGPIYPIHRHHPDGSTGGYDLEEAIRGVGSTQFNNRNIVAETLSDKNSFVRNGLNGRAYAEIRLTAGLKATFNFTLDSYDYRRRQYVNNLAASSTGNLLHSSIRTTTLTANQLLAYENTLGNHAFSLLAGHESYSYKYEYLAGQKSNQFLNGVYDMYNFRTFAALSSYDDLYNKEGYFLQTLYHYGGRYHFSASWRRDGSSRFSPCNRWGNFWSVGVAWNLAAERWLAGRRGVDGLTLRASYGVTGNDRVLRSTSLPNTSAADYYPSQTFYNINVNNASEPGIAFAGFGNSALKWETQAALDVALEYTFAGRVSGSLGYFRKDTRDLLFKVPPVLSSGASETWENVGKLTNSGVEISLDIRLLRSHRWDWSLRANAATLHNEIIRMPASRPEIVSSVHKLQAGKSLYAFWLKEYRGVNSETGDPQYAFDNQQVWNPQTCFVTSAGDSLTYTNTLARSRFAGSALPKLYGGVGTSLRYRCFDVAVECNYSVGGKVYNTGYQVLMYNGKYGQAMHRDILRRWQQPGDLTDVPRLDEKNATQVNAVSDRWLCRAGYFHLKSVTLRYRLPDAFLRRRGIREASLFVGGENLHLWSAMKELDPRQLYKGVISVANPPSRTYTFGLNITL